MYKTDHYFNGATHLIVFKENNQTKNEFYQAPNQTIAVENFFWYHDEHDVIVLNIIKLMDF